MSNTFKKSLAILSIALLSSSSFIYAATEDGFQPPNQAKMQQRMTQQLNLTEEQQSKFGDIMKQQHDQAKAFRKQHQQETEDKLSQILTSEQMEKFRAIKKQHQDRRNNKKQGYQQGYQQGNQQGRMNQ